MKKLKGFFIRHSEWMSSFWSNFVATVLGIVLTFGVSEWLEHRNERIQAELLVDRSFTNIEQRLADLGDVVNTLAYQDSLLAICSHHLPDQLDSVPTEVFVKLLDTMGMRWSLFESKSVEIGFKQNFNTQKILGSFADVLGEMFETLNYLEDEHKLTDSLREQIERKTFVYWANGKRSMTRTQCLEFLTQPDVVYTLTELSSQTNSMIRVYKYLTECNQLAHKMWAGEITFEQFEEMSAASLK